MNLGSDTFRFWGSKEFVSNMLRNQYRIIQQDLFDPSILTCFI